MGRRAVALVGGGVRGMKIISGWLVCGGSVCGGELVSGGVRGGCEDVRESPCVRGFEGGALEGAGSRCGCSCGCGCSGGRFVFAVDEGGACRVCRAVGGSGSPGRGPFTRGSLAGGLAACCDDWWSWG